MATDLDESHENAMLPYEEAPKSAASFDVLLGLLNNDTVGNGVDMANGFVQPNDLFAPVVMRLMPGKAIPEEVDHDHDIIGIVLSCDSDTLLLRIGQEDPIQLKATDDFVIPAGVRYSVQNTSETREALVKFLINL
jgi:hypothetical protein